MTKLYIANTMKQHFKVQFRAPESRKATVVRIAIGTQMCVGDFTDAQLKGSPGGRNGVIAQLNRAGIVEAREIRAIDTFIGACYTLEKPVILDRVEEALAHNEAVLDVRGEETRKNAAVAMAANFDNAGLHPTNLEIEIQEESKRGEAEKPVQSVEVVRPGYQPRFGRRG